jgi:DegV family protein with EDD domain
MQIVCSEGTYRDGVEIQVEDIYRRLETEIPKSSTPSGADVEDTLSAIVAQGYTKLIAVLLSGGLSSTYNQVKLMAESVEELEAAVFDSHQGSIGYGAIVLQAAEYAASGMKFGELKEKVAGLITKTKVFFSIDTLKYLQKGGRIGKATELIGSLLDIKPILSFDAEAGQIYTAAKVRSRKAVEKRLLQLVGELKEAGRPFNLIVADGGAPEQRDALEQKLCEAFPGFHNLYQARIGAALSIHLGSGLLGAGIQYLD